MLTTRQPVDFPYTRPELDALFHYARAHAVENGGHYDARSAAVNIWSHHWQHPATQRSVAPRKVQQMKILNASAIGLVLLAACGPSSQEQEQIRALKAEVERLKAELEDVKFGAGRLLAQAKSAFEAANDSEAHAVLVELLKRHPDAPESNEGAALLKRVDARIAAAEEQRKQDEQRRKEEARLALERATKNLKQDVDEIRGITWMKHKSALVSGKYASLYFGTRNGSASGYPVRLQVQYYDDDWLFVRSLTIKADEKTYELRGLDFKRDHSSRSIWEWVDMPVTDHEMLAHVMSAKRVIIRFHGNTYDSDFTLPSAQQNQMREVYAAWRGMGGAAR
jgi:hypothetical protein